MVEEEFFQALKIKIQCLNNFHEVKMTEDKG